jgi:hypothetical protein
MAHRIQIIAEGRASHCLLIACHCTHTRSPQYTLSVHCTPVRPYTWRCCKRLAHLFRIFADSMVSYRLLIVNVRTHDPLRWQRSDQRRRFPGENSDKVVGHCERLRQYASVRGRRPPADEGDAAVHDGDSRGGDKRDTRALHTVPVLVTSCATSYTSDCRVMHHVVCRCSPPYPPRFKPKCMTYTRTVKSVLTWMLLPGLAFGAGCGSRGDARRVG